MPICAALGCSNSDSKGYVMLPFPKDAGHRKLWETNIKRTKCDAGNRSYLCEEHFDGDKWRHGIDGTRALKSNAVPTLFLSIPEKQLLPKNNKLRVKEDNAKGSVVQIQSNNNNKNTSTIMANSNSNFEDPRICRICFVEGNVSMFPLESEVSLDEDKKQIIQLTEMINTLIKTKIRIHNKVPNQLCLLCVERLINAYLLLKQCEESERKFQHNIDEMKKNHVLNNDYSKKIFDKQEKTQNDKLLQQENKKALIVHCKECRISFYKTDLASHITDCKMRKKISKSQQPQQLLICKYCSSLVYLHEKDEHDKTCAQSKESLDRNLLEDETLKDNSYITENNDIAMSEDTDDQDTEPILVIDEEIRLEPTANTITPCSICGKSLYEYEKCKHESSCKKLDTVCAEEEMPLNNGDDCNYCQTEDRLAPDQKDVLKCRHCNKSCSSLGSLKTHELIAHHKHCKDCGKNVPKKMWQMHCKTKCKSRKHICTLCNAKFSKITDLQIHVKVHTVGDLRYKCKFCPKQFQEFKALRLHNFTHKKSYECLICNKRFLSSLQLSAHQKDHNDKEVDKNEEDLDNTETEFLDVEYLNISENDINE